MKNDARHFFIELLVFVGSVTCTIRTASMGTDRQRWKSHVSAPSAMMQATQAPLSFRERAIFDTKSFSDNARSLVGTAASRQLLVSVCKFSKVPGGLLVGALVTVTYGTPEQIGLLA